MLRAQGGYFFLEVGQRFEPPVHRGEPQVGDLIKITERAENGQPHLV